MSTIIAAIISSLSATVGIFIKYWLDNRSNPRISSYRRKALSGEWKAEFTQKMPKGESLTMPVTLSLHARRRKITADIRFTFYSEAFLFKAVGRFEEPLIFLNYTEANRSALQFGAIILELSATSEEITGYVVGFGPISKKVIVGSLIAHASGRARVQNVYDSVAALG